MADDSIELTGLAYPVFVGVDGPKRAAGLVDSTRCSRALLIYDRRVRHRALAYERALRRAGVELLASVAITAGEAAKSYACIARLHGIMARRGADRRTVIVAIGGGSLTDAAGFAAATYMRGVPWLAAATTLLGMVDASIGGKTAINLDEWKNLVGAFWDPIAAIADLPSLATLAAVHRRCGVAEMVKAAIVGDPSLFETMERLSPSSRDGAWRPAIVAAARVKIAVVERDPKETGARAALNLGHSVAHGLEAASHQRLPHGDAVAIGLRAEGLISLGRGWWSIAEQSRMTHILKRHGLPVLTGRIDAGAAIAAMRRDKKRSDGIHRFALPLRVGEIRIGVDVAEAEIERALKACERDPAEDASDL